MLISVILAHPNKTSFNHAIAQKVIETLKKNGHTIQYHDLYQENFDPLLPTVEIPTNAELPKRIKEHCEEITKAEGIIIVHPNWWGQPPAILKGWVDRIIRPGVAYQFLEGDQGEGVPQGLLKAQAAVVFNTSNTQTARELWAFKDPLETIWKNCIFGLCGVTKFFRRMFNVVVTSSEKERKIWLDEVEHIIIEHFPVEFEI